MTLVEPACSDVGRQIMDMDEREADLVLTSVLGVKSPNTGAETSECFDVVLQMGYNQRQLCIPAFR